MKPHPLPALCAVAAEAFEAAGDSLRRPHGNCYWLIPGALLAGEHPGATGMEQLATRLRALGEAGVSTSIDLTTADDPVPGYALEAQAGVQAMHLRRPISDFGVPGLNTMHAIAADVDKALVDRRVAYLHCRAGIGRTGTVAACLMVCAGLSAERALTLLAHKWQAVDKRHAEPHTPETDAQRAFIAEWQLAWSDRTGRTGQR